MNEQLLVFAKFSMDSCPISIHSLIRVPPIKSIEIPFLPEATFKILVVIAPKMSLGDSSSYATQTEYVPC